MTMTVTLWITMVGWVDVPDSDWGDLKTWACRRHMYFFSISAIQLCGICRSISSNIFKYSEIMKPLWKTIKSRCK